MKQVSHRGYLLVGGFPEGSKDFGICMIKNGRTIISWHEPVNEVGRGMDFSYEVKSFNGLWEIIGKGNEITEEVWAQILVKEDLYWEMSYRRYPEPGQELAFQEHIADTATESGHSLIKSHGMKPETTLILKLKTNE